MSGRVVTVAEREENPRLVERLLGWADRREVKEGRLITFGTLLLHEAAAALEAAENAAEDVAGEAVTEASVTPPGVDAEPVPPLHILCAVLRSDPGGDYYAVRCQAAAALEAAERERDEAIERGQNLVDGIGMERERREAAEREVERAHEAMTHWLGYSNDADVKLAAAERRVAELTEALTAIARAGVKFDHRGTHSAWVYDTAREALAAAAETNDE